MATADGDTAGWLAYLSRQATVADTHTSRFPSIKTLPLRRGGFARSIPM